MRRLHFSMCLVLVMFPLAPAWGFAHALHVACTLQGDKEALPVVGASTVGFMASPLGGSLLAVSAFFPKVEVEGFYDDNTPAIKADVQVVNAAAGVIVAQGTTDAAGKWFFATPPPGTYEVRVNAGAGHRAKTTLVVPASTTTAAPSPDGTAVNDGPKRADLTRTPWLKILIGLVIIGGCSVAFLIASLLRKKDRL
jgi:hypothetical protein